MTDLDAKVARSLQALDDDFDLEVARAAVRARVAAHTAEQSGTPSVVRHPARTAFWGLSRAAGILLVTAAAAYAWPGSPVRQWMRGSAAPETITTAAPAALTAPAPEEAGVRVSVAGGALRVVLQEAAPGTEIHVRMIPGAEAAVYAPSGSRFTSAAGRLEARLTPGPVRVELPRGVDPVSLEVGSRMYLRGTDAGLEVTGPVTSRTDDEIVFRIPGG